jgi:hypothetical protein
MVGAILSGAVFELFVFACVSLVGSFNQKAGGDILSQTFVYCLGMAVAGAVAGSVGGFVGRQDAAAVKPVPTTPSRLDESEENRDRS